MTETMTLEELETWIFRFCFGQMCEGWKEPSGCQYANGIKCKLVVDVETQEPVDYCPLVRFLGWLKKYVYSQGGFPRQGAPCQGEKMAEERPTLVSRGDETHNRRKVKCR